MRAFISACVESALPTPVPTFHRVQKCDLELDWNVYAWTPNLAQPSREPLRHLETALTEHEAAVLHNTNSGQKGNSLVIAP